MFIQKLKFLDMPVLDDSDHKAWGDEVLPALASMLDEFLKWIANILIYVDELTVHMAHMLSIFQFSNSTDRFSLSI